MLYKGPPIKTGITINGKDASEYNQADVANYIASMPKKHKELVYAILRDRLENSVPGREDEGLPDDYAKEYGRPSLTEMPFGTCPNDGMPYLKGHSPMCDGKPYHNYMCKCKYDKWNHEGGSVKEIWPGMDIDDFDM